MVACVLIPRFSLRVASPEGLDEPVALAPLAGSRQTIGEVSPAAGAAGLHPEMALGEALARCPSLRLIAPDPARAAELWDALLGRIEGIGAAVESKRPGEAFFAEQGLRGIHGGDLAGVIAATREAAGAPVRIAVAPNRFAALLAAGRGSHGEAVILPRALRRFLGPFPVGALSGRLGHGEPAEGELVGTLKRLGIDTLGKLAVLSSDQLADRFGSLGLRALWLARGEDTPLRPRRAEAELVAEIELPDGTAGPQLDRALGLLAERLLADPARKGRTVLALRLSALLDGGGSWSTEQGLGRPAVSASSIGALLAPRLADLPGPASTLRLRAIALGPPLADQLELAIGGRGRERLAGAVREVRTLAGAEALLKVIDVDPRSRVPERRMLLSPLPEG